MNSNIFWAILIFFVIVVGGMSGGPQKVYEWASDQPAVQRLLNRVVEHQLLPGPLRGTLESITGDLTRDGVISYTNEARSVAGLPPMRMNDKLNRAAKVKLDDMFAKQYFEHESPDGKAPADLITEAGYEYLVVGENLALGNFGTDAILVDAWMNSPGHRANILHDRFQEIGVAVGKGTFEGKTVWLAVQEFGTPMSTCPSPSTALKTEINANRNQIQIWQTELEQQKRKLETTKYSSQEAYQRDQDAYNELVRQINEKLNRTKEQVEQYNLQVNDFNACLEKNG